MKIVAILICLISNFTYAGGINCKECPAETDYCAPIPNCVSSVGKPKNFIYSTEYSPQNDGPKVLFLAQLETDDDGVSANEEPAQIGHDFYCYGN